MGCGSHTASSISHRTVKDREIGRRRRDERKKEYVDEENR
jgi:hypothetical protein